MPKVNPEIETFARIMVIGVGGSGKNAINHMINSKVKGVEFIVVIVVVGTFSDDTPGGILLP